MHAVNILDVLKYYPEVTGIHDACLAVPEIAEDDFESLSKSISSDGLRHEIILTKEGLLIDGRNRLIACFVGKVEPRFKRVATDPWQVALAENIARRHLSTFAKAAFGDAWRESEEALAKLRQEEHAGTAPGKSKNTYGSVTISVPAPTTRDIIGKRVGVSGSTMDKFRDVKEYAPDAMLEAMSGKLTLEAASRVARKRKKEKASRPTGKPTPVSQSETVFVITVEGKQTSIAKPNTVRFNATTNAVDWAAWTWNPITGCEHGCKFCYAREIANSERMKAFYPNGFEPTFHEYRLDAPKNTRVPVGATGRDGRVFVCSMADLFGKWVPKPWIKSVFDACLTAPEWEYLFLTKWPARYSQMPLLEKAWYGASVIQQSDVARVEKAMQQFDTDCTKWISLEPMLQPIVFNDLSWCNLVVIGSQTSTTQPDGYVPSFAPEFDWIVDVVNQCRDAGVPYYLKANLGLESPGMNLPKSMPRVTNAVLH